MSLIAFIYSEPPHTIFVSPHTPYSLVPDTSLKDSGQYLNEICTFWNSLIFSFCSFILLIIYLIFFSFNSFSPCRILLIQTRYAKHCFKNHVLNCWNPKPIPPSSHTLLFFFVFFHNPLVYWIPPFNQTSALWGNNFLKKL